MSWIKDLISPKTRQWEEFYRNRHQHDKVVRSTHGVNCTGGCSWNIHVKDGIVVWETQALDYPLLEKSLPPYEPRGCQRGISFSWYLYSPIRVKYPMIRGALIDVFNAEKAKTGDPLKAWENIQQNSETRRRYQRLLSRFLWMSQRLWQSEQNSLGCRLSRSNWEAQKMRKWCRLFVRPVQRVCV